MMEGEAVEIFAPTFKYPKPKVARMALKKQIFITSQIEPLRYRHLNFDELIRHQIQALIFLYFHQGKEKSPSAASRGKPKAMAGFIFKWLVSHQPRAHTNYG
ncbi:hypothetical protein [Pedobacter sp. N23S346]|uniref:hypothetical protein n=1 Tax=Pedobacter sp. N23S346 TaxID=3402750 RepID=UPI003AC579DA